MFFLLRSVSEVQVNRFPKQGPKAQASRGILGTHPSEFFWLFAPKGHLSWVSELFSQDIGQILTWKVFFIKNVLIILFMKNLTNFHKTVETDVDLRLIWQGFSLSWYFGIICSFEEKVTGKMERFQEESLVDSLGWEVLTLQNSDPA